jgi:hypothetical protein
LVTETDSPFGRDQVGRKRGHPHPVAGFEIVFAIELPSHGMRFQRTDDTHRNSDLGPGKQVRKIPPRTLPRPESARLCADAGEQTGGILIQMAAFIFEYDQGVFAVSQKKVEKRGGSVERIDQD